VASFTVRYLHSPGEAEENHEEPQVRPAGIRNLYLPNASCLYTSLLDNSMIIVSLIIIQ
jgi:hypothetical protein